MQDDLRVTYGSAEALRKRGRFAEACEQFGLLWQRDPLPVIGRQYALCLRMTGRLEEAEEILRQILLVCPADGSIKSELGRILYELKLKPAAEAGDLTTAVEVAGEVLGLDPGADVRNTVVLGAMRAAKVGRAWETVLELAGCLRPETLNRTPDVIDGKTTMPQRAVWYLARARALFELKRFAEAREVAIAGLVDIPGQVLLKRVAALALAGCGDLQGAIAEMRQAVASPYRTQCMRAELGELLYRAGEVTEAYRLVCSAMLYTRLPDKRKPAHLALLAELAFRLGKLGVAMEHVALVKALCASEGREIPARAIRLDQELEEALEYSGLLGPHLPDDPEELLVRCSRHWREGEGEGLKLCRGTVMPYPYGSHFAFILSDDGDKVFVLSRDLPRDCRWPGSRVGFVLTESYDRCRGVESVRAVNVRRIDQSWTEA